MRNKYSNAARSGTREERSCETPCRSAPTRLLTQSTVCDMLCISRSTLSRWTRQFPEFPQPRKLSGGSVRWIESEIEDFIESRPRAVYEDHGFDPNALAEDDAEHGNGSR